MARGPLSGSMCLDNVTGPHALNVNGIYEPTDEMCGTLTVFRKKGNDDQWLEYHRSKWRVRKTSSRGTDKCTAWIVAERPCLPQDCTAGLWHVDMNTPGYEISPMVTLFGLMIDEYFYPLVLLVRARIITVFLGRSIMCSLLGNRAILIEVFNSILFS